MSEVELIDIEKAFGEFKAVRGVSMTIEEGEFVSLLGPSGSGKTTTLRIIAGFEDPTAGDVQIAGKSVVGQRPDQRGVGIVFQNYALFPQMNVFENVAFGLRAQRQAGSAIKSRVAEMLELVGLGHLGHRRIHELSGGQQQRVALARALAVRPRVLLLDEPLGALDKKLREQMELALMELHRTLGMTMVYVTHDQEEALSMSQRVAVMSEGKIVQLGSPDALYNDPATRYVCEFVGRTNVIRAEVSAHDGDLCVTSIGLAGRMRERVPVGDACVLCVRPERITLAPSDAPGPLGLRGRVIERVFRGQTTNYVVELEVGGRIEASLFTDGGNGGSPSGAPSVTVGDEVVASFAPDNALVFAADSTDGGAMSAAEVEAAQPD